MLKKIAKYALPKREKDLDTLANSVYTYGSPHITGQDPDWTDIPIVSWTAFVAALNGWGQAYAACKIPHLPSETAAKNQAEAQLRSSLMELLYRGLLLPPRTAEDVVAMGFHLVDYSHRSAGKVTDTVDIESIANGTIPGTHTHIIRYRIQGRARRAKAPYKMAVFQIAVRGSSESAPDLNTDEDWGRDHNNVNEPFTIHHGPEHTGKTAYYRACWQASAGPRGPWAMSSAPIP